MIKKIFLAAALLPFLGYHAQGQVKLIEKVEKKGNEIVIPYVKYQLPNGLILIIHEDHSDPAVHVDVTYHVGSAREELGRSGFAHFFEHMMFQGSDHVKDDEHFKIVSQAGGTLNGTTNLDRTNYFETLPNNQLETALWLEADRMGFLLDSVTQRKFEVQRSTVKNERGQRYDNTPYGRIYEKTWASLYPTGHPYSWPTIGSLEDLDRADVNDLKRFFLRWYGPNNATLTVAGDVDPQQVITLVEKYFGPINRGPEVKMPEKRPTALTENRYISYEDNVRFPMLMISYPTVPSYDPDEAPLDVLSEIIGGGKNSIFYKNFEKSQKAVSASAQNATYELSGDLELKIKPFPGKTLAEMETLVNESLAEFEKRGATDDDLIRFKASFESALINSLSSVSGKASQLAAYQTFVRNPNYLQKDLDRYLKVTKEDVMRVYNKYIKGKGAVVLSVYPKGKPELVAKPDNYTPVKAVPVKSSETAGLVYNKPTDKFDRSQHPKPSGNPVVKVPDFWKENFGNGLKIIGVKNNEIPSVTLQLNVEAGHVTEAADKSKAGIARLTASLLDEATQKRSAEEMSSELEKLGSSISISSDKIFITITISTLLKNLDKTLALAEEKLFHPKMDQADFDRLKKQQIEAVANQGTQAPVIANNVYNKLLFGNDHIMGISALGTESTLKNINLEDVKAYYEKYFSPSISNLVIVGDIEKAEVLGKLNFLKTWKATNVKLPPFTEVAANNKAKLYLVDKENAPQSEIRIGYVSLPYDATGEFYKANLMNFVLGGAFNSHINMNLREDKGWTYGARSGFGGDKYQGPFTASAGVRGNATDSSVVEFVKELKAYREKGITEDELNFTKSSIGQSDALRYESPLQKAIFLKRIVMYNLDKNFVEKQNEILKNIKKEEIDEMAKKYLPVDNMVIVVVGDKKSLKTKLEKLGYEVVELDKEGNQFAN